MEPFWNEVRVKQVIGRGSRNKSHNYLHPDENYVTNFVYTSVLQKSMRDFKQMIDKKRSNEEITSKLLTMTPAETAEIQNENIQEILKLHEVTEWNSHIKLLYGQYMHDRMFTSDEFVSRTAERKQILIDQGLKLFVRNSIERTMKQDEIYESVPVFLSPYTVYQNPNIPLQTYLVEIRDTLKMLRSDRVPEPSQRYKIPVYYVPHFIDPSSVWKQELVE